MEKDHVQTSSRKTVYVSYHKSKKGLSDLYVGDLIDICDVIGSKQKSSILDSVDDTALEDRLINIRKSRIVLVIIEDYHYDYLDSLIDIGIAVGLGRPIILFDPLPGESLSDSSSEIFDQSDELRGQRYTIHNHPTFSKLDIYWSKIVKITRIWKDTKTLIKKIFDLIEEFENESDVD